MSWAKLDDNFPDHPKVAGLSDAAFRLHVRAICYAQKYRTLGEILPGAIKALQAKQKHVEELVDAACWDTTSRGGWMIHDFLEYNPTSEQLAEKRANAGRVGGQKSGQTRRSKAEANASENRSKNEASASIGNEANDEAKPKQLLPRADAGARPVPEPVASDEASGFGDRFGTLEVAFGGHLDQRLCDEFTQIATDYSLEEITVAIAEGRRSKKGGRLYPSVLYEFLPSRAAPEADKPAAPLLTAAEIDAMFASRPAL